MKTFSASVLSKTPARVLAAAREEGAIIQMCRTNGEVIEEFVLLPYKLSEIWPFSEELLKKEARGKLEDRYK